MHYLIAVYVNTEMFEREKRKKFYFKLESIVYQCQPRDTLIVFGEINAFTGTENYLRVTCRSPWSWHQKRKRLFPFELCKIRTTENCWFLVPEKPLRPLNFV